MPSFLQEQACLYSIGRLLTEDMSISSPIRIAAYGLRYIFDGGGFTLSGDGTSSILPALFHVESGVTLELRNIVPTNTGGHAVIVDGGAELVAGEGVWFRGNGDRAVYMDATAKKPASLPRISQIITRTREEEYISSTEGRLR